VRCQSVVLKSTFDMSQICFFSLRTFRLNYPLNVFIFSIPNGKPSSITKNSQKEATTTNGKDIPDESTRSGKNKIKT